MQELKPLNEQDCKHIDDCGCLQKQVAALTERVKVLEAYNTDMDCQAVVCLEKRVKVLELAGEMLVKALKASIQMRDFRNPKKLEEHLAWVENDELAAKWAKEAFDKWAELKEAGHGY